jgi:hypothetical protein
MADGHLGKCKECAKKDVLIRRNENIDYVLEYDRNRGKLQHRKDISVERTRNRRNVGDGYGSAHNKVLRAIKNGSLKKEPCCMCGSIMVHAHHDDYSKPLDVMWLCSVHHSARHTYLKYIESIIV